MLTYMQYFFGCVFIVYNDIVQTDECVETMTLIKGDA